MAEPRFRPRLTPHGHLLLAEEEDALPLEAGLAGRLAQAFDRGSGHGLLQLGAAEVGNALPPELAYWRDLGLRYVSLLCAQAEDGALGPVAMPPDLEALAAGAPPMIGAEYLTPAVLRSLWEELDAALRIELAESRGSLQDFLQRRNPAWNLVGRVHFNLAENRKDEQHPFAFLATYTTRLTQAAKAQHLPLGEALKQYAGAANKERLLSLLVPVQRAAKSCAWLKAMVDAGELFHPLRWTPREAYRLLCDVPALQAAGVVVRMPAGWGGGRPARAQASATVGAKAPSALGVDGLLDFSVGVALDGEPLTERELRELLSGTEGLALVRGRWVEVDRDRLKATLERFRAIEAAAGEGVSFAQAMRLLSGAQIDGGDEAAPDAEWSRVAAGPWLAQTLQALRSPEGASAVRPGSGLNGTLRPYQETGVRWLYLLGRLGLGACLADDMGLGKTVQVLSLLLLLQEEGRRAPGAKARPSLLVAPASLLANWAAEAARFAPSLKLLVAHPSAMEPAELKAVDSRRLDGVDLVVTSYGSLLRLPWLAKTRFRLVALDEAQAIKSPAAKQTRAAKALSADARIALTGTPVENRLSDLWSLFDFVNPGLLGAHSQFAAFAKRLAQREHNPYGPLRDLVRPYILRRLKTDRAVAPDLPDKTELKAFCGLSRRQAALYGQAVDDLARQLEATDGMKRRGVVLASLMRLKQICNHPSQWLGDGAWAEADSGKLLRLRELAEVIAAKQEKVLVFTQFREATGPLSAFLGRVFGREGLVLHGETEVKKRKDLVRRFQEDEAVPFFVLSLKAGGTGLNLTAASHVVHFDRWWNPAVEDQATDRAFRIGQTRNVLVHKLVCRGTVEERVDALIESKKKLAKDLLEGGAELLLTELKDEEALAAGRARPAVGDRGGVKRWAGAMATGTATTSRRRPTRSRSGPSATWRSCARRARRSAR
ncbi:MAG: DEAD/DEAH box helicase [Myxococcales bacterium]